MSGGEQTNSPFRVPGLGALEKIQMGPGVVGRTSYVVLAFMILSIIAMTLLRDNHLLVAGIFGVGAFLISGYVAIAYWYANKYPHHSVMDGAHFVRHAEIQQAAKNPEIIDVEAEPVANTAPPKAITSRGTGGE